MAKIEDLFIGTRGRWRNTLDIPSDGLVVGRRMNGVTEGDVDDPNQSANETGKKPDRVKIRLDTLGIAPETLAVSCDPANVDIISDRGH